MSTSRSTLRLPGELHSELLVAARRLGVSVNALVLVAVRDYLDRRSPSTASGVQAEKTEVGRPTEPLERPQSDLKRAGGIQVPPVSAVAAAVASKVAAGPSPRAKRRKRKR
jgi:hypothetical protein